MLNELKNNFDFFMRNAIRISRKDYAEKNESKQDLIEKFSDYSAKFDVSSFMLINSRRNFLENCYTLELLDKYLNMDFVDNLSVLDIGCKNWFYVKAEHVFFKKYSDNLLLDGIEIDANRLYSNFYSRYEVAKYYMKGVERANYIKGDFLNLNNRYDIMIWQLPFVFEYPHKMWGLPKKYFKPEDMLIHAFEMLNTGGKILIVNQGIDEFQEQCRLCKHLDINLVPRGEFESKFLEYSHARYVSLIEK